MAYLNWKAHLKDSNIKKKKNVISVNGPKILNVRAKVYNEQH